MADLDPKLRELDGIQSPDLWSSIEGGQPPRRTPPLAWHRVTAAAVALLVGAAGVGLAGIAFVASRNQPVDRPPGTSGTVSSSAIVKPGLRCTATVAAVVQPGEPTGLKFTYENMTAKAAKVSPYGESRDFTLTASDGTVYDTAKPLFLIIGGFREPIRIPPGGSRTFDGASVPVRWGGPLTIAPRCEGKDLPLLTVSVADPGPTPSVQDALERTTSLAGIFGDCMPGPNGEPVVGTIAPPDGADYAPIQALCWADIEPYGGFVSVTLAFVSPPPGAAPKLTPYGFDLRPPAEKPAEASYWSFVVTADAVTGDPTPAGSANASSDLATVDYSREGGIWSGNQGSPCGGLGIQGPGLYFFVPATEKCLARQ